MMLTITTTHRPPTDLGYLLHKNPARAIVSPLFRSGGCARRRREYSHMFEQHKAELETRRREALKDPRTTADFVNLALTEPDENTAWDAVVSLHFRGTQEVFD